MDSILGRQLGQRLVPCQRRHRHLRLELRTMLLAFHPHDSRSFQSVSLSLPNCPNFRDRRTCPGPWSKRYGDQRGVDNCASRKPHAISHQQFADFGKEGRAQMMGFR